MNLKENLSIDRNKKIIVTVLLVSTIFLPFTGILGVILMWTWMKWSKWIKGLITAFILFVILAIPLFVGSYLLIARPFKLVGHAMNPNYRDGQYVMTSPVGTHSGLVRGDVVIMELPDDIGRMTIKRVVGLPNEEIMIQGGMIYVDGKLLDESEYLEQGMTTKGEEFLLENEGVRIPMNQYFVLGDNRTRSSDSRSYGFVSKDNIVSRTLFCFWKCGE